MDIHFLDIQIRIALYIKCRRVQTNTILTFKIAGAVTDKFFFTFFICRVFEETEQSTLPWFGHRACLICSTFMLYLHVLPCMLVFHNTSQECCWYSNNGILWALVSIVRVLCKTLMVSTLERFYLNPVVVNNLCVLVYLSACGGQ